MEEIYYDPSQPGSFGGVESIYRAAVEKGRKIPRRKIQDWLRKQAIYTLHKPAQRRYTRNRVIVGGIDDYFQADLVDLQSLRKYNDGYKYLRHVLTYSVNSHGLSLSSPKLEKTWSKGSKQF